jgi:hypothetical protein
MLVPTDLPAKHEVADRGLGAAVPQPISARVRDRLEATEAAEMARDEEARESYIASLRSAQTAAERAVIDAVLEIGEAVEALYAIEQNLHAEGQPEIAPGRMLGPAWDAIRNARRFWREWYPQFAGLPPLPGEAAPVEQARRRLTRAQEGLRKAEETGEDERCLASWRATVETERVNAARLEGRDGASATPVLTEAHKAYLKSVRRG